MSTDSPLLLSIETSTKVCSVALHQGGVLLAASEIRVEKSHSSYITIAIENLFKYSGTSMKDLDAVAVSQGPGSYTGLRIGVSTAKGLCYALDKPLIAINTLKAMAMQASPLNFTNSYLCPMTDARRMEVYCMVLDSALNEVEKIQAKIIDEDSFSELLEKHSVLFLGDGAMKCFPVLGNHKNALFTSEIHPSAVSMGNLALESFKENKFEDLAYFEPFYLKDFVRFGG